MTTSQLLDGICEARSRLADCSSHEEVWRLTIESVETFLTSDIDACELLIEEAEQLVSQVTSGTADQNPTSESVISSRVADQTYRSQQPVLIRDTATDDRIEADTAYRSVISVPLGVHGVLQLAMSDPEGFDEQTFALVDVFGGYVTRVLDKLPPRPQQGPSIGQIRTFLEIADVMMVALDTDGQITYVNQKACEILGYEQEDLVGHNWFEMCVPERNRAEVRDVFDQVMAGEVESVDRYENPVITDDGDERLIEWHNTVLRDETGVPTGTLSSGLDITARKEYEQTLREEREKYSTLVDQFPNGLVTLFDEDFRYQIVGGTGFDQLSRSAEEFEGQRLEEVFPAENVEALKPLYQQALEGESNVIEQTLEGRVFRIRVVPVCDSDGDVTAGMTISQDVTERKELQEELREQTLHLQQAQEIADIGSWHLDIPANDLDWSEACYRIFGMSQEESLTYDRFLDHVHPEDREYVNEQWTAALEGEPYDIEHRIRVNGQTKWVRETAELEFDEDGEPIRAIGVVQDITERKERERELEQYETIVETVTDGICVLNRDSEFIMVNEAFVELTNSSREELLGAHASTVRPAELNETFDEMQAALDAGADIESIEMEIQPDDSESRTIDARYAKYRYEDDVGRVGVWRDITERKEREQALEIAKKRYQTLLQAAPDPIFVADTETGEIIEANEAAEELRGQSREEIIGLHQSELHPNTDDDAYRQLFEEHVEEGGTRRQLADGSPIYAVTQDGEQIPVEISVQTIELAEGPVIYGIFRDISTQLEYERALTNLNEAARKFFKAETPQAVGQCLVETVIEILDLSGATFYRFDEGTGVLQPTAYTPRPEVEELFDGLPVFEPGEGIAWQVFTEGERAVFDDVRTDKEVYNPETPIRSELIIPIGDWGVLIVGDTRTAVFDDRSIELVEILSSTANAALERVEREQDLKQREQQLEQRTQQLEDVESINAQIRDIARAIVNAETQQEIEQAVCAQLAETDSFDFAWIGDVDPVDETLIRRAQAGDEQDYLNAISLDIEDEAASEPAVQTARTGEPVLIANTATDIAQDQWRTEAVRRGFQSVMSIPLVYQGTLQGVLTIYTETQSLFTGIVQSVLVELGELIAHAIAATNRKQALLSNRGTELEFNIQDPDCFFLRFAQETDCTLDLEGIVPQSDESTLVFVRIQDGSPAHFLEEAERASAIESTRLIESNGDALIQLRFVESFIASILADQGLTVHDIAAEGSECRVTVVVPSAFDIRRAVDIVKTTYSNSEIIAKREQSGLSTSRSSLGGEFLDKLTPRQREVAEVAYLSGYFESPRGTSSDELADELGFSVSAFHHHIRAAERKLFEAVFENGSMNSFRHSGGSLPE